MSKIVHKIKKLNDIKRILPRENKTRALRSRLYSFTVNQIDSSSNTPPFLGFYLHMIAQPLPADTVILVAEDNDFVRMQIVKFLHDGGYQVVEAINGDEALAAIRDREIDLAMVDIRMEPMDGFEFIRTIRGLNVTIPVVLVTGDNHPDLLEEANKWGVTAVLIKPVQKERLMKTVERTIRAYHREA